MVPADEHTEYYTRYMLPVQVRLRLRLRGALRGGQPGEQRVPLRVDEPHPVAQSCRRRGNRRIGSGQAGRSAWGGAGGELG
jgi:hypothetical protein